MASFLYIETEFYAVTFFASMGRRKVGLTTVAAVDLRMDQIALRLLGTCD
jgi:hypothetical protein